MQEIVVQAASHAYKIHIGENIRFKINEYIDKDYSSVLIITDDHVEALYLQDVLQSLKHKHVYHVTIASGEASKSFENYYKLQTEAIQNGLDRQSLIIALGGGVVGDLAGFVAATFMRGIDYIQVPTTILAHDSSVGGKVAINHELGKNLIGNFYPPQAVIYDVATLTTLGQSEVRSGYAELIKEALIANAHFFEILLKIKLTQLSPEQLVNHLSAGIKIKANIVEADEKEAGVRKYLNLGHTLGHAIEAELGYGELTHGEAVAIGMLFALKLSEKYFSVQLPYQPLLQWLERNDYPLSLPNIEATDLLAKMKSDKKTVNKKIQMVLLKRIGEPIAIDIDDDLLYKQLQSFLKEMVKR